MNSLKDVVQYCRAHINDYDEKVALALCCMGRHEQIDWNFAHEIESYAMEWADENGYDVDFLDGINVEEIINES